MNEPERVTSKEIRYESIILLEEAVYKDIGVRAISNAAMFWKCINKCKKWVFKSPLDQVC